MVSVLIPAYNTDVRTFVGQLIQQFRQFNIEGEIVCIDDASAQSIKEINREITTWAYTRYIELDKNIGRSRIRNMLAREARYSWLLFVDSDSAVCVPDYIDRYLQHTQNQSQVVYGGTAYGPRPENKALLLHWLYGTQRECITAIARSGNPSGTFKTNNFFLHKTVMDKNPFNETIKGYGHEDTLFALDIKRHKFSIKHIENPLQHTGLEINTEFLKKQHHAIKNLAIMYRQNLAGKEIKLIKYYTLARSLGLLPLVRWFYLKNPVKLEKNLLSPAPQINYLDRLKLGWFMDELKNTQDS